MESREIPRPSSVRTSQFYCDGLLGRLEPLTVGKPTITVDEKPLTIFEPAITVVAEPLTVGNQAVTVGEEPLTIVEPAIPVVAEPLTIDNPAIPVGGNRLETFSAATSGERADHDVVTVRIAESELSGPGGGIRLWLLLEVTDKGSGA